MHGEKNLPLVVWFRKPPRGDGEAEEPTPTTSLSALSLFSRLTWRMRKTPLASRVPYLSLRQMQDLVSTYACGWRGVRRVAAGGSNSLRNADNNGNARRFPSKRSVRDEACLREVSRKAVNRGGEMVAHTMVEDRRRDVDKGCLCYPGRCYGPEHVEPFVQVTLGALSGLPTALSTASQSFRISFCMIRNELPIPETRLNPVPV